MKILAIQISNKLINPDDTGQEYYDKLYSGVRPGYYRGTDFWEIPQWVALLAGNVPELEFHVCKDLQSTIDHLRSDRYDWVCFSVLEVNKAFVKAIAQKYHGDIAVGGYVDMTYFNNCYNVVPFDSIPKFLSEMRLTYRQVYDYRHFKSLQCIPRLQMSQGCLHACLFCDVKPHGKIEGVDEEIIIRQVLAFRDLDFKLIYLDDKTFGQCDNHTFLPDLYDIIKDYNPHFLGFIVQTTAIQVARLSKYFLKRSRIVYAEIGIESYNDNILKIYHKPASERSIDKAFRVLENVGIKIIPNIIVGLPEENKESYTHTLTFLDIYRHNISHCNIYNLAVYRDTPLGECLKGNNADDQNENVLKKSYMQNVFLHQWFSYQVYRYTMKQLER